MKTRALRTAGRYTLLGAFLWAAGMFAGQAWAGTIVNSPHDFSGQGWSGGEICIVCHTPHNANTTVTDAPLWNHAVTTTNFTMYTSPTLDATQAGQPDGVSMLCLSCHDGTVAVDSFGGNTGTNFVTGNAAVGAGGNLDDDHPISILYNAALATTDPGLFNPETTNVTIGDTAGPNPRQRTGTITNVMLFANTVQCSSCHDVHNTYTVAGSNGDPLLKVSRAGSALCLTCHNK